MVSNPRYVMMVAMLWSVAPSCAFAEKNADIALLQTALNQRYPDVQSWLIKPTKEKRFNRPLKLFSRLSEEEAIYRDGNLFVISFSHHAEYHYLVAANVMVRVAMRYAPKGAAINEVAMTQELRDVFALRCKPVTSDILLGEFRLRRDIHRNEAICANDIESTPAVSEHQRVELRCARGKVTVSTVAEALGDAQMGDWVKVRREGNHPVVTARVVARGKVNACT